MDFENELRALLALRITRRLHAAQRESLRCTRGVTARVLKRVFFFFFI
jgi:hypothetical protein